MAIPGRRRQGASTLTVLLGLLFLFASTASAASAVLGVDLGTEYIKGALVKPGIPLEIVLSKDSKRKEASAVAFKPSKSAPVAGSFPERFYGSDALALAARFPQDVYPNLKPLLGVPFDGPDNVKEYSKRHPALDVQKLEDRPYIAFKSKAFAESEAPWSVEELLAMELQNLKENAVTMAGKGTEVNDVVFTVPAFYTADEKQALMVAADLAGLKVLGLISDGLAVGLNYATSRTFPNTDHGGLPEYHMVFDMGAGSTTASVIKFREREVKDVGRFNKTIQEVQVVGTGWDRTLGGDSLNGIIMDDMVEKFLETPGAKSLGRTAEDVKSHGRTAAKLWKDAERVRHVLSANSDASTSFEGLYEDVDFRYKISRATFEELAASFAARVEGPVVAALNAAGLTFADIESVILHGGAVRTPFVQRTLEALVGDVSKIRSNVNADEAAVFGAAFKAASLSPSFRVKEIRDIDVAGYATGVQFMWNLKDRLQKIFTPTSPAGTVKEIPFKMMGDFEFTLYQTVPGGGEELVNSPVAHVKTGNLTGVVTELIDKEGCDREDINTRFSIRLSPYTGLPEVLGGWVSCEVDGVDEKKGMMDGVKNMLGFGGKKDQEPLKDESSTETVDMSATSESSSPIPSSSSAEASESSGTAQTDGKKSGAIGKRKVESAVTFEVTQQGYEKHPRKELQRMKDRLAAFTASDLARRAREEVLNNLEAFTYLARDLLEDSSEFAQASTEETRTKLTSLLSETSDWIYGEGADAPVQVLKEKLNALTSMVDPVVNRIEEAKKRPEQVKLLKDALDQTNSLVKVVRQQVEQAAESAKEAAKAATESVSSVASDASSAASSVASEATDAASSATASSSADPLDDLEEPDTSSSSSSTSKPLPTPTPPAYTEADLSQLEKVYNEVSVWIEEKLTLQDQLQPHEDPALLSHELEAKAKQLNDAVMELLTRQMRRAGYGGSGGSGSGSGGKQKAGGSGKKGGKKGTKKGGKKEEKPVKEEVKDKAEEVKGKVEEKAGEAKEKVEETAEQVKEKVRDEL